MDVLTRLDRRTVYRNRWMTVYEDRISRNGDPGIYSVVKRPDAVTMCVSSPNGYVLMLNSFRYPTGEWSLELPMGAVDPGESPAEAAARELREETGLRTPLQQRGSFFALPGLSDQRVYVFSGTATDDDLLSATSAGSEEDLGDPQSVRIDDLREIFDKGRITDSLTLCSLVIAGLHFAD